MRLGCIVSAAGKAVVRSGSGEDGRALLKEERDVALEMDGVAGVDAGGEDDRAAAVVGCGIDSGVDGWRVDGDAVTFRAEAADVVVHGLCRCGH